MSYDATLATSELYTNMHLRHRRQVLNSPQVNLSQRDKDRLLLLLIGGNDLFGPLAPKVEDLRKDPQVENVLLLAEAIEQMKGLRPKALCWRHVLLGPWLTSIPWTWPAPNKPETPTLELLPGSCQVPGDGRWIVSGTSSRPILSQSPERSSSPRTRLQHLIQHHLNNRVTETSDLQIIRTVLALLSFPKGMVDPVTSPRNSQLLVGGKLATFHHQWAQHFPNQHKLIRKVSQGLLISFWDEAPPLLHGPLVLSCNNKAEAISLAIQKPLKSQAIEEVQNTSSPAFYSRLFFVPKPYGSFCPIIDLKVLNQYLEVPSFKMEILFSIAAV